MHEKDATPTSAAPTLAGSEGSDQPEIDEKKGELIAAANPTHDKNLELDDENAELRKQQQQQQQERAGAGLTNGVDVRQAEDDFAELRRELTRVSSLHRVQTDQKDTEMADGDEDDFDLLTYLKGSKGARDAHGMKNKSVASSSIALFGFFSSAPATADGDGGRRPSC